MLIDNKFLYISLPRCGSTAFHYSCILAGLDVKSIDNRVDLDNSKIDFSSIDESKIMNFIEHGHTPLIDLQKKFGYDLPIVSIRRNKYERFYSLYKHIIFELDRIGLTKLAYKFSNFTLDELFFFDTLDIATKKDRYKSINEYLINLMPDIKYHEFGQYGINIIDILLTPISHWHGHNNSIKWFDINELQNLEEWVSSITDTQFKLKHVNSSSFIETYIKLDSNFIDRYKSVYDYYDIPKEKKTLI